MKYLSIFFAWLRGLFRPDAPTPAPEWSAGVQSITPVQRFPYGTTRVSMGTAKAVYGLSPPAGMRDPVLVKRIDGAPDQWLEEGTFVISGPPTGDSPVPDTTDDGRRTLNFGEPVPFKSQRVPDERTFLFRAQTRLSRIATAFTPGGVGESYLTTAVQVLDERGNVVSSVVSINDITQQVFVTEQDKTYRVKVTLLKGGAVTVVYQPQ